jgi:ligand-binding sensor domain-containing protein
VTFGLPDGIPASARTIAFADDGDGGIWFASSEGLTHFDRGRVTTYTPADGIPEQIHTLHLDRRDQLWLGSNDGLQRLEGNRIVTYLTTSQLPDGSGVQTIADDDEGNLWLGAGSGVTIYDGSSLRTYTGDDGVPGARALAAAGEGVWIGGSQVMRMTSNGQISRLDSVRLASFGWAQAVATDGEGLWFAESERLWHFDGTKERQVAIPWDLSESLGLTDLAVDDNDNLWVSTWGHGASVYDGVNWRTYTTEDGLVNDQIMAMHVDRQGRVWAGGLMGGVSRLDAEYRQLLTVEDGLAHNLVMSILEDDDGSLWFGHAFGAISRWSRGSMDTWDEEDGIEGRTDDLVQDSAGDVWAANGDRLSRFTGDGWEEVPFASPTRRTWIRDLHVHQGNLWLSSNDQGGGAIYRHVGGPSK